LFTTKFNINKLNILPIDCIVVCVSCASQNEQRLFPTLVVTVAMESVYCAVRAGYLNKEHDVSNLKG